MSLCKALAGRGGPARPADLLGLREPLEVADRARAGAARDAGGRAREAARWRHRVTPRPRTVERGRRGGLWAYRDRAHLRKCERRASPSSPRLTTGTEQKEPQTGTRKTRSISVISSAPSARIVSSSVVRSLGERGVRSAQKMQVDRTIPVGIQR